jgi:hypothetical protein
MSGGLRSSAAARRAVALGITYRSRVRRENVQALCRRAQWASRHAPESLPGVCSRLVQSLSEFGREDPEAKIRARMCGCPVR